MRKQRLEYIDFAKGFAILLIVIFHYCQPYVSGIWSQAIMFGGMGVHLFFVLSGFGLGLSARVNAVSFYKKRFVKILVPYYIIILLIYMINFIHPMYDGGLYALSGHLFFFKMFDEGIIGSFGYHFWFLSTIIQFYLCFPLISWAREKMSEGRFVLLSLLISASYWVFITYLGVAEERTYNSFFLQYLWEFNLGVVLSGYAVNKKKYFWEQSSLLLTMVAGGGISLMALMALKGGHIGPIFNDIPASLGYISLSALCFSIVQKYCRVGQNFLVFVGRMSFELYLIHMVVFLLLRDLILKYLDTINILISLLAMLPVTLCLSYLIHKIFLLLFYRYRVNTKAYPFVGK